MLSFDLVSSFEFAMKTDNDKVVESAIFGTKNKLIRYRFMSLFFISYLLRLLAFIRLECGKMHVGNKNILS